MPQDDAFVADVMELLYPLNVRSRRMFGSCGVYCDEKFVMIIADDQVFLKRTPADPGLFADTEPAPPFEGATDWNLVPEDMLRDIVWLRDAVQATADALPAPTPKKPRRASMRTGPQDDPPGPGLPTPPARRPTRRNR